MAISSRIATTVTTGTAPWITAWDKLISSPYASFSYIPGTAPIAYRGSDLVHAENYNQLYQDIAADALAIKWRVTGDAEYDDAAARIIDT